jgi:phage gpG-like protein
LSVEITVVDRGVREMAVAVSRALGERKLLAAIGARHLRWVSDQFRTEGRQTGSAGPWKPLRPSTIAGRRGKGGSAKILRDTGRLAQSFTVGYGFSSGFVEVGTADRRARWHHEGTRPYVIRPVRAKALRFRVAGGSFAFARSVRHPGLPARTLVPRENVALDMAVRVIVAAYEKVVGRGAA